MAILHGIFTFFFIILCVLLVIIILLQSDKSAGMGILGGSSQSAFGSSTADVITKITAVMIALFMIGAMGMAVVESQSSISMEKKILQTKEESPEAVDQGVSAGKEKQGAAPESGEGEKEVNVLQKKLK